MRSFIEENGDVEAVFFSCGFSLAIIRMKRLQLKSSLRMAGSAQEIWEYSMRMDASSSKVVLSV